jgi:hypothetical protein
MTEIITSFTTITLNVNSLSFPIKRHRLEKWMEKHGITIFCIKETYFTIKNKTHLKVKAWEKIFQCTKQDGVAIFISDKAGFKPKLEEIKEEVTEY